MIAVAACALAGSAFAQAPATAPAPQDQTPHAWRKADGTSTTNSAPQPAIPDNPQNATAPDNAAPVPPAEAAPQTAAEASPWPAQDPGAAPPADSQQQPQPPAPQQNPYPPQPQMQTYPPQPAYQPYPQPAPASVPATVTISPGTYITVRLNGWLSSDRNQPGDAFTATLAEPLIVNGVVIAQRGQTVGGVVTEAKKAGHVEGTSRLGVKLTDITLADGQKVNLQTAMVGRRGDTSVGRDAAAIGGTTALGAAVGAGADWGRGAAIGAGAGAAAGILGVLLTRGHPTVIYPETALTFRVETPATIDTTHAPQAFRYADESDYGSPYPAQMPPARMAGPGYGYGSPAPYPPAPYYGPAYNPYYSPYPYWGAGFSLYLGPGFYYRPRYYTGGMWIRRR
ncbi:MAG TPA: hypothetical protein VG456_16000 [Candidatus Sulfopaludibacter sp.]|nr:hypothetical protein [Candidatus Sulfopaludibacter sp.]